jgi:Arc/MetJ family transcription regulator
MATNLALDDRLIEQARRAGGHKTKKEAVTAALRAYVKACRRGEMLDLAGTVEFWPGFDHRDLRRRKSA